MGQPNCGRNWVSVPPKKDSGKKLPSWVDLGSKLRVVIVKHYAPLLKDVPEVTPTVAAPAAPPSMHDCIRQLKRVHNVQERRR